jgi:hypothetical protein
MGCYPLFACRDWSRLGSDVEGLGERLVSLTMVTDPFGEYDEALLRRSFPDLAVPFKQHCVIDLHKPVSDVVSRGHRKEARRALRAVRVHVHPSPAEFLDTWMDLHRHLVARHRIRGIPAFSRAAFAKQLATPGIVVLWAALGDEPVAATLYLLHDGVAYGHVLGCTDAGYKHNALYALIWSGIETLRGSAQWIDLMGVPGADDAGGQGIRHFKQGWTPETRTAWLCGRILNARRYDELVRVTETARARYFPAYRDGEMTAAPEQPS